MNGDFLTTTNNSLRINKYIHSAGRTDFNAESYSGMDRFDAGVEAACAALGA